MIVIVESVFPFDRQKDKDIFNQYSAEALLWVGLSVEESQRIKT